MAARSAAAAGCGPVSDARSSTQDAVEAVRVRTPMSTVLVHLASGIGNVVLATPLLVALDGLGFTVDVLLSADYGETADLLRDWTVVRALVDMPNHGGYDAIVPAIPPFYWRWFAARYRGHTRLVARPPDALFYTDEQEYYVSFAR